MCDLTIAEGASTAVEDVFGLATALDRRATVRYFGDYEIKKELGRGGMGVVYEARQVSLNRPVALKMIRAGVLANDAELRRFQNEAEAVAMLDHPGIVPIFEVGEHDGQRYFSMKKIDGVGLDRMLADFTADPAAAARLVATTASAIHHAHQRGILHRDLKPANVLVDAQGEPHLTDFGLAKRVAGGNELTTSGVILGTPAYMAPEQASGRRGAVTTQTDVYGLGAILYALIASRPPFNGATVLDTLDQVRERPPESPRKYNAQVPRDLMVICLKCLEKDPRRRYASADALAEDLRRFLANEPIAARPVSTSMRAWMWCRRNPAIAGAIALAAASLVLSLASVAVLLIQEARHREAISRYEAEISFDLAQKAVDDYLTNVSENTLLKEQDSVDIRGLRRDLLKSALTFYEQFAAQRKNDPRLRVQLAKAYFRVGQITREIDSPTQAMSAFRAAQGISEPLVLADPMNPELSSNLAECFLAIGKLDSWNGNFRAALTTLGRSRAILESLSQDYPTDPRYLSSLADCYSEIGIAHAKLGEPDQSLAIHRKARDIQQGLIDRYPENLAYQKSVAENLNAIGFAQYQLKDKTAALKTFHEVQNVCHTLLKQEPYGPKPPWLLNLIALSQSNIGNIHKESGDTEKALPFLEEALKYQSILADQHPSVIRFREKLAESYKEIAARSSRTGMHRDDKALPSIKRSIEEYGNPCTLSPRTQLFTKSWHGCGTNSDAFKTMRGTTPRRWPRSMLR